MLTFSSFEYLCIDIANQYGMDKLTFDKRIQWTKDNIKKLEKLGKEKLAEGKWKEYPLYVKAVMTLRKAQAGIPTGHMVHFDATCSGMQIMSATTGCEAGAFATGLTDPNRRADAYTDCHILMKQYVPALPDAARSDVKDAVMTSLYGSKAEPKKLFGEGTPELEAFYKALQELAPGAVGLLNALRSSWQPFSLKHSWVLPDNHHVHVKVTKKVTARIKVAELGNSSFSHIFENNMGLPHGLSNVANVVHSIDGWILRTLVRRCDYDIVLVNMLSDAISEELLVRDLGYEPTGELDVSLIEIVEKYRSTGIADLSVVPKLENVCISVLPTDFLKDLNVQLNQMLTHEPFDVVTVHDSFACLPKHMNQLRYHYKEIMAQLADSTILDDIFSSIHGEPMVYEKLSTGLGDKIRNSNYAIC